jgi:hypothetical protein
MAIAYELTVCVNVRSVCYAVGILSACGVEEIGNVSVETAYDAVATAQDVTAYVEEIESKGILRIWEVTLPARVGMTTAVELILAPLFVLECKPSHYEKMSKMNNYGRL